MINIKNITLFSAILFFTISTSAQDSLIIHGTIDKSLNNKLLSIELGYANRSNLGLPNLKDSCKIIDGKFFFALPVKTFELYTIRLEDKEIEAKIKMGIVVQRRSNLFYLLPKFTKIVFLDTLLKKYEVIGNDADQQTKTLGLLTSRAKFAPHEIIANTIEWLKKNDNALASTMTIFSLIKEIPDGQILDLFSKLPDSLKTNSWAKEVTYYLNNLTVEKIAPEFSQADTAGKVIKLSDFRGKYLLLEFWASWCAPCRAETPYLKQAYRAYNEKNFDILSVSLDHKRELWLNAIKQDKLLWPQVSDLKGWENEISWYQYKIGAIPSNFLLGPDGRIIAKNLSGKELLMKLRDLNLSK